MSVLLHPVTDLVSLLDLERVKPDAFLGSGPGLGYGRIYGGQVVAQALRAAANTVDGTHQPHSLHAYFVRAGDDHKPVLYEVERVRDGRSFTTRQVVAYQQGGAILNLIASFHAPEGGDDVQSVRPPDAGAPDDAPADPSDAFFEHRSVRRERDAAGSRAHSVTWMRVPESLPADPVLHACAFAYLSDEDPLGVALLPHPLGGRWDDLMTASLDHAIWFHRPLRADDWLCFELDGHGVADARGLSIARVFDQSGVHVASVAQEGLARRRHRPTGAQLQQ